MDRTTQLRRAFERFDRLNPQVWEMFLRFTLDLIGAGRTSGSADAVIHRIRWETTITTTGEPYKISNNHVAYYARKFADAFPLHADFFHMRTVGGEEQVAA